jgi:hypothetical protein
MITSEKIIADLDLFRFHIENAQGHAHLYGEFNNILKQLVHFRELGEALNTRLASGILKTVDLLLRENRIGRIPGGAYRSGIHLTKKSLALKKMRQETEQKLP